MELPVIKLDIAKRQYSSIYALAVKPMIDFIAALILFIISLPVCFIVAGLIKLDSAGPVLFRQCRIGKNGKMFTIYKFRTMYAQVPKEGRSPTSSTDSRITRVGRVLRKTSLDEIPQLINILNGEMSFVGPRPEQKSIVDEVYTDYERMRLLVKPGLTGPWQVSKDRTKPIHENLRHDFSYIANLSFWGDIKIIMRTIRVIAKSNTA